MEHPEKLESAAEERYPILGFPVVGEHSGEWALAPEFRCVRINVCVSGVQQIAGVSNKLRALEGKNGYLLPVDGVELVHNKIPVYGVGKNGLMVKVPITCIRPRRADDEGHKFYEVQMRVVVIGPDRVGNTSEKGKYGFTIPASSTQEIVDVQFPHTPLQTPFPYASLCFAKNERIQTLHYTFDITSVPVLDTI